MKRLHIVIVLLILLCTASTSGAAEEIGLQSVSSDGLIRIEAGSSWLHDFPLFLWFKQKNRPQFAVWIEDAEGNYIETLYVTKKAATEGWIFNGGNRRKEALPYWAHRRGTLYSDGIMLPTKDNPLPDTLTSATPKGSASLSVEMPKDRNSIVLAAEFNHSIDFNDAFPIDAVEGTPAYSGGKMGSGQPSLVYRAGIDLSDAGSGKEVVLELAGHSSADGNTANLFTDLSGLTTALDIVSSVVFVWTPK